jgi:hypothetical protein
LAARGADAAFGCLPQEEKRRQEDLKRQREEEETREYRRSLRFKVIGPGPGDERGQARAPLERHRRLEHALTAARLHCAPATAPPPRQARPMPKFDAPFFYQPSDKPLTNPKSPNFAPKRTRQYE